MRMASFRRDLSRRRVLLAFALFFVAAAIVAATTLRQRSQSPAARYEEFFRRTLAEGSLDENTPVLGRFASSYDVCIYGPADTKAEALIKQFFRMVRDVTWMRPNLLFRSTIVDCPISTFFYILHHDRNKNVVKSIAEEIYFISKRYDLPMVSHSEFHKISPFGVAVNMVGQQGKRPRAYAAVGGFLNVSSKVDAALAETAIQQELLQAILYAPDIKVDQQPISIIEERDVPNSTPGSFNTNLEFRARGRQLNVPNMCLYDIMLLMTLYARDESIIDVKLGSYIRYIRNNYSALEKAARQVQNDPRYRDIFVSKC